MSSRLSLPIAIAIGGAGYMAALAFGLWLPVEHPFIGSQLYDLYGRSLLHGRFDLPAYELRFEGHYAPDGTGYLYHGLGPLLMRLPFLPFVKLPTTWLSPLTIWLWAVVGNACYHRAFGLAWAHAGKRIAISPLVGTLLAILIWFGAPGILLVANGSLYHEPIAMAYGLGGCFVVLAAMVHFGRLPLRSALLPLSVVAGLMVHARPHLAVGLYIGVLCLALIAAKKADARGAAVRAITVLGLFGALLLTSNYLRFHETVMMHGSFEKSDLQYGWVYWRAEDVDSPRAVSFKQHGQFNAGRILPNVILYVFSPPSLTSTLSAVQSLEALHGRLLKPIGYVRVEDPRVGTLFLWPLWMLLMVLGLKQRGLWKMPQLATTIAVFAGGLLMLSYATVTLRYHFDLWMLIALPALFGVAPLAAFMEARSNNVLIRWGLVMMVIVGVFTTSIVVIQSRAVLMETPGQPSSKWTPEFCLSLTSKRGFSLEHGRKICGLDGSGER